MPTDLIAYITHYAYLAIFSLVFLQELGVPNPVPNELILLFAGYLAYSRTLSLGGAIFAVVLADVIGTTILYIIFYFFGHEILEKKPKWLPISKSGIERVSKLISGKDIWGIYLGRLLPYVRGYTSVVSGLIQINPFSYLSMVVLSAITWSGGYVLIGFLSGPEWEKAITKFHFIENIVLVAGSTIIILFILRAIYKWYKTRDLNVQ